MLSDGLLLWASPTWEFLERFLGPPAPNGDPQIDDYAVNDALRYAYFRDNLARRGRFMAYVLDFFFSPLTVDAARRMLLLSWFLDQVRACPEWRQKTAPPCDTYRA